MVLLAGNADRAELSEEPFGALQRMSVFGPLVVVGVFAATLSSDLSSFLGAPRILLSRHSVPELIVQTSASSDLVLLGMARKDLQAFDAFVEARGPLLDRLPPTLLVASNGEVDLLA